MPDVHYFTHQGMKYSAATGKLLKNQSAKDTDLHHYIRVKKPANLSKKARAPMQDVMVRGSKAKRPPRDQALVNAAKIVLKAHGVKASGSNVKKLYTKEVIAGGKQANSLYEHGRHWEKKKVKKSRA